MKKICLIISLLILTGCSVEYDIEITNEKFEEYIKISENDSTKFNQLYTPDENITYKERIKMLYRSNIHTYTNAPINPYEDEIMPGVNYYEKELIETDEEYGIIGIANGDIKDINNLNSIKQCYDIVQVINNKDEYILSTSFKNICFEKYTHLNEININITTDMKVNSNNADSVSGNTYTWKITRENYNNKSISLEMQSIREYNQDKYNEEQEQIREEKRKKMEKQKGTTLTILAVVGVIFLVIVACLGISIMIKNRKENKL